MPTRRAVSPAQSKIGVSTRALGGTDSGSAAIGPMSRLGAQSFGTRDKAPPRGGPAPSAGSAAAPLATANSALKTGHRTPSKLPARGDQTRGAGPTLSGSSDA